MLLHICRLDDWNEARPTGAYVPRSFDDEGFVHCSTPDQVLIPANAMFRGQTGLVLLVIDEPRLTSEVVVEDCYESGIEFPHVYGPIDVDAVVDVVPFEPNPDGSFSLPTGLG